MQRLYSTFPCGFPGAGLLLLRGLVAIRLIHFGYLAAASPAPFIAELVSAGAAILLVIGLWTPIAGVAIAVAQFVLAFSRPDDPWTSIQFGVLGAAIAMLGPGGCSVDARLFGRKQIQIP